VHVLFTVVTGHTVFTVATAFSIGIYDFIALQFVARMFMVTEIGVGSIVLTEELPARYRGRAIALMIGAGLMGGIIGSLSFPWLVETRLGWRSSILWEESCFPFWMSAALCFWAETDLVIAIAYTMVIAMNAVWAISATITSEIFPTSMLWDELSQEEVWQLLRTSTAGSPKGLAPQI